MSATHLPGEEFAVTVHGRAVAVGVSRSGDAGVRGTLIEVYAPRCGDQWATEFLDHGPIYARIAPERMFTFRMNAADPGHG